VTDISFNIQNFRNIVYFIFFLELWQKGTRSIHDWKRKKVIYSYILYIYIPIFTII